MNLINFGIKYLLLILLTSLVFLSCDDDKKPEKEEPAICKDEDCTTNAKCVDNECKCDLGYITDGENCVINLCVEPNPCKDDNRTICSMENGFIVCGCDAEFHLEADKCVTDVGNPCYPNPCTETNETRCLLDASDNTKAECHCDANYHTDGDLCCQAFSHNESGVCTCNEDYLVNPDDAGECLVKCSKKTMEAFHGICENNDEICIDGECVNDLCKDFTCPDNSECIVRETAAQCQCNEGLHLDNNLCCMSNSSNIADSCTCDTGYILTGAECVAEETNPCEVNGNPCTKLHKNKCTVVADSYTCECNVGYQDDNGICKIITTGCGEGSQCLNNLCIKDGYEDDTNFQCLDDDDCNWNGTENLYCVASPLGGICNGCGSDSDCPGDLTICNDYGSCSKVCSNDNDCPTGYCANIGYCGRASCTSVEDCPYDSACIEGWCNRKPCVETECSIYNPSGTCTDGKTCVYGSCIDSCTPNPCTVTPIKTVCNNNAGVISCSCESGYTENETGECVPNSVTTCPTGFTCESGFCTDRNDSGFVCANDDDCGEYASCSTPMTLPAGKCTGCTLKADCPHVGDYNIFECVASYCLATCSSQSDCNAGMICAPAGTLGMVCKTKECTSSENCPTGYVCDGDSLKCERTPCTE